MQYNMTVDHRPFFIGQPLLQIIFILFCYPLTPTIPHLLDAHAQIWLGWLVGHFIQTTVRPHKVKKT